MVQIKAPSGVFYLHLKKIVHNQNNIKLSGDILGRTFY